MTAALSKRTEQIPRLIQIRAAAEHTVHHFGKQLCEALPLHRFLSRWSIFLAFLAPQFRNLVKSCPGCDSLHLLPLANFFLSERFPLYILVNVPLRVYYGNFRVRGVVERLIQHLASPHTVLVSRPCPECKNSRSIQA